MKRLNLEIQSVLGNVSLVSVAVNAICLHAGLDASESSQVELCVVEAATNSIRHGYLGDESQTVKVEISTAKDRICIAICDSGLPLPEEQIHKLGKSESPVEPVEPEPADLLALPEGGRGLDIIRSSMDHVAYSRNETQNRLTLTKYISR